MNKTLTIATLTFLILCASAFGQGDPSPATAFRPAKSQITAAQEQLKASGSYTGPVDGRYNDEFREALKEYQKGRGLETSGRLDQATLKTMSIGLTDSQKGIKPSRGTRGKVFRASKDQITQAQNLLRKEGAYKGDESGKYSPEFRTAIRDYQAGQGIRRTGSLNRATLEKMGIALSDDQQQIPVDPKDLQATAPRGSGRRIFRASKDQIAEVQRMLRTKGLYSGEPTGKLDDETRGAIRSWQSSNSVKATGTLNKETLVAMGIGLSDSQKEM